MQLHINIEVDDEVIEQAAINAIKTKIRELLAQETNHLVYDIIHKEVERQVNGIKASDWRRSELEKKAVTAVSDAAAKNIAENMIVDTVNKCLKNVSDAATKAVDSIQNVDVEKIVQDITSDLVKTLFGQTISKMITDAVLNKKEQKNE